MSNPGEDAPGIIVLHLAKHGETEEDARKMGITTLGYAESTIRMMRASLTDGYARRLGNRALAPWHIDSKGDWRGNPARSQVVATYMKALTRRQRRQKPRSRSGSARAS